MKQWFTFLKVCSIMLIVANKPIMLSAVMLSAVLLNVVMPNVVMLNVVILHVEASFVTASHFCHRLIFTSKTGAYPYSGIL